MSEPLLRVWNLTKEFPLKGGLLAQTHPALLCLAFHSRRDASGILTVRIDLAARKIPYCKLMSDRTVELRQEPCKNHV